jgi:hypothetical protein
MMRRLLVIVFKMLKKNETFRSINEENHARKLEAVEKLIRSFESLKTEDIESMRERARLTYDPAYREMKMKVQCPSVRRLKKLA